MYYSPLSDNQKENTAMKYKIIKSFPGSPDGMQTINFAEGDEVEHVQLGDELAEVALGEKWIKAMVDISIVDMDGDRLITLLEAIGGLQPGNKAHWTNKGAPETKALKEITGGKVSGAERDYVWNAYQLSEYPVDDDKRLESLVAAIELLDEENEGDFIEALGKPSILALEVITGGPVSGVERDVAWIEFTKEDPAE